VENHAGERTTSYTDSIQHVNDNKRLPRRLRVDFYAYVNAKRFSTDRFGIFFFCNIGARRQRTTTVD
jgi:hypothetical protein